eukprot:gene40439-49285_t
MLAEDLSRYLAQQKASLKLFLQHVRELLVFLLSWSLFAYMFCLGLSMFSIFLPLDSLQYYRDSMPLYQTFALYLSDALQQLKAVAYELYCTLLLMFYSPEILATLRLPLPRGGRAALLSLRTQPPLPAALVALMAYFWPSLFTSTADGEESEEEDAAASEGPPPLEERSPEPAEALEAERDEDRPCDPLLGP